MSVEDAIKLLDQIWKQVPLVDDVNKKAAEAVKVLTEYHKKQNEKEKE
jgi:hypothetical protein